MWYTNFSFHSFGFSLHKNLTYERCLISVHVSFSKIINTKINKYIIWCKIHVRSRPIANISIDLLVLSSPNVNIWIITLEIFSQNKAHFGKDKLCTPRTCQHFHWQMDGCKVIVTGRDRHRQMRFETIGGSQISKNCCFIKIHKKFK